MQLTSKFLAASILALPLGAAAAPPDSQHAVIPNCQVFLIHDVEVPAQEAGLLTAVEVAEGNSVKAGALLAQIDDSQALLSKISAELEREAARTRADDDIEVRYAEKSYELAKAELAQDVEVNKRSPGTVPAAEVRRKELAATRASLQIDRSRLDMKVAQMTADVHNATVKAADENILRRRIVAPFDGQVVQVLREANEWVNVGEPVVRVIRLDRLRVDGFVNATEYNVADIASRPVTVEVELARGRKEQFPGQIVFVNPLLQAGHRYRVRAEVQNRQERGHWLLNPGSTVTMVVHLQ